MRDILIIGLVLVGSVMALKRPWIGVMLWTWLSIMNPHRFTWGAAYDAPLAAITAAFTLTGFLMTSNRESPFKGSAAVALVLFMIWATISWLLGLDVKHDYTQWSRVMKIDLMILIALALLHTKQHIFALAWVVTGSLAILGAKGGLFTLLNAGSFRVWGPPGSFIEDNNAFALALVMTIPLLRFLQLQLKTFGGRHAITAVMLLCAIAALGSYSRGGFMAIGAMTLFLWWRGNSRFGGGIVLGAAALLLVAFMPDLWMARMETIREYEVDASAMGRINAWVTAWGIALNYPTGIGFDIARPELFARYGLFPDAARSAHSNYFQILANHGFVGLALYLWIFIATWRSAGRLRSHSHGNSQANWCAELGAMCQVSLVGYAVGGAFLDLAYFDLPYNVLVLVLVTEGWLRTRAWEREPVHSSGWWRIPGLALKGG